MNLFLKNDDNKPSVSLTMVVISFNVVTLWLIVWVVGTAFGLPIPPFDAMAAMGYLTPLLTLYFGRRFTSKIDLKNQTSETSLGEVVDTASPSTPSTPTK
jgi:hypothetical protein